MLLDDWITQKIKERWPTQPNYPAYAETAMAEVWKAVEPKARLRVKDVPIAERLALVAQMTAGHEGCIEHLYVDSVGLVTVGVGTMVDRENKGFLDKVPLTVDGREATAAERRADVAACRAHYRASSTAPSASAYAGITRCRITPDAALTFAGGVLADMAEQLFNPAFPNTHQHKEHCADYPLLAWMILVDMAFNLGNAGLNKFPNLNTAIRAGHWDEAARQSLVRGVSYQTLATRYVLLKACGDVQPATGSVDPPGDDPARDGDVHIGATGDEGTTIEKVLRVPTLSQLNPRAILSVFWSDRAAASMIYNYYRAALGKSDFIVNSPTAGQLVYPDGTIAAPDFIATEPLERARPGWRALTLFPVEGRRLPLDDDGVRAVVQPLVDAIDQNNPALAYTSISKSEESAAHAVVISGYRAFEGALWLHIDDPFPLRFGAGEAGSFLGPHNVELISEGAYYETGSRYWLRASRLFEPNDHSLDPDDLWCDHTVMPGLRCILNPIPTRENQQVDTIRTVRVALPVDLGLGHRVSEANLEGYHDHIEVESAGGYFPLGANSVWHGGVHIRGGSGAAVVAAADGEIVAARLPDDEDIAIGAYGSSNFILIRHALPGRVLNRIAADERRVGFRVNLPRYLRSAPAIRTDSAVGLLRQGDALELLSDDAIEAEGYSWYHVEVSRSSSVALQGRTGYVAHSSAAFENRYAGPSDHFIDARDHHLYSLYVHLAPIELDGSNPALRDIPWLKSALRLETTADEDDPTISASVGQGARNLRADVGTVQTLLTRAGHPCGEIDRIIGRKTISAIRAFQSAKGLANDGVIAAGGMTWRTLLSALGLGEGAQATAVDDALLGQLAGGRVVGVGRRVRAGEKLWVMGEHGSEGSRGHMLHFEMFSGENLFPTWKAVIDDNGDFNMDSKQILDLIEQDTGWFEDDEIVTADEVRRFYQEDPDARSLRHTACKFTSEWGIDLDVAIERMKGRWYTYGLREKLEPYVFYPDIEAVTDVPDALHYHYNPIAVLEALAAEVPRRHGSRDPGVTNPELINSPGGTSDSSVTEDPISGGVFIVRRDGEAPTHYRQGDPAWGNRTLGTGSSLSKSGCAVTSLAMILEYHGRATVTPGTLDAYLDLNGGYAGNAVKWGTAMKHEEATTTGPQLQYKGRTSSDLEALILSRIHDNRPTLARVDYGDDDNLGFNHFVVIIGRNAAGEFIMHDPGYSDGDGIAHPSLNIVQGTNRKGGYRIVEIDIIDPVGAADPPSVAVGTPMPGSQTVSTATSGTTTAGTATSGTATSGTASGGVPYGGFTLQYGDLDTTRKWGGVARASAAAHVADLQGDLVALGYWISSPMSPAHKGMLVDGHFGKRVRSAVYLFQLENGLPQTGKVDQTTAQTIAGKIQGDSSRPSHAPANVPGAAFYQLPPSTGYGRYGDIMTSSTGYDRDIWGTKAMIDCIRKAANAWQNLGNGPFLVGDISLFEGGYFPGHSSHKNGTGADVAGGNWCDIRRSAFDRKESLKLARLFVKHGARRILFNCKYVIDNCTEVKSLGGHFHHYHIDVIDLAISQPKPTVECKKCHADVHAACDHPGKLSRA